MGRFSLAAAPSSPPLTSIVCSEVLRRTLVVHVCSRSASMEKPIVQETDPLPEGVPWYRGPTDARPFILSKVLSVSLVYTIASHPHVQLCTLVVEQNFLPSISLHRHIPLVCFIYQCVVGWACYRRENTNTVEEGGRPVCRFCRSRQHRDDVPVPQASYGETFVHTLV